MTESKCLEENVLFIRAGDGFIPEGIRREGFRVEKPFVEKGLLLRLVREAWFRLKLPFKDFFYNKSVLEFEGEYLIIYDPQITQDYLEWLLAKKKWKIVFFYGNMVGRARHLHPTQIPKEIDVWTYDGHDSRAYGIQLNSRMAYYRSYCQPKQETKYDLMYVGRDKGRIDFLTELERSLNQAGIKTFFRIVGDTRFEKKKDPRYGKEMTYDEVCSVIAQSRAILNITLPNQEGITVRDFEAICNNVKLITTNSAITKKDYYDPARILVIDEINVEQIIHFLDMPYKSYESEHTDLFEIRKWIEVML